MSQTVSRGLHTAARWRTPALALAEHLSPKNRGPVPQGAVAAIEQFFDWVTAEISRGGGAKLSREIPLMGAVCALGIARETAARMNVRSATIHQIDRLARRCRSVLRKVNAGSPLSNAEKRELRRFLNALAEEGLAA